MICPSGKHTFQTRGEATAAVRAMAVGRNRPGGSSKRARRAMRTYRCPTCNAYHLASR